MKTCSRCAETKPRCAFTKDRATSDGLNLRCRDCTRAARRGYYSRFKDRCAAQSTRWWSARREETRRKLWEHKLRNPCVDCGNTDPRVLQFDHVRGEKTCDVTTLAFSKKASWPKIAAEIKKCEVRCANCHALRSWERAGFWTPEGVQKDWRRRLSDEDVREIRRSHAAKEKGMTLLAKFYDVSVGTIWNVLHRRSYSDVE
jgi:hypothetical protein